MSAPITEPPMAYKPQSDTKYLPPVARLSSDTRHTIPSSPAYPKPISLGRQIHEAYDYQTPTSHEFRDLESMSDRTSVSYSRATSVQDTKYQSVYSPTFSHASRMETGRYSPGRGASGVGSSSPYGSRDPSRSKGPVFEYQPPSEEVDQQSDHAVSVLVSDFRLHRNSVESNVEPLADMVGFVRSDILAHWCHLRLGRCPHSSHPDSTTTM